MCALLVIDNEGNKLLGKYYSLEIDKKDMPTFEKQLFLRASKLSSKSEMSIEVMSYQSFTVIFRFYSDVSLYIIGQNDNELVIVIADILSSARASIEYYDSSDGND